MDIRNKNVLKEVLSKQAESININNLSLKDSGLYNIEVENTLFNCFFYKRKSDKLYVFLSAIGNENAEYPYFTRLTWPIWLDGNAIFIEDPTRRDYKIAPAFYMGNCKNSGLNNLYILIDSVKKELKIDNSKLLFISSSNGGYASIFISNKIKGSTSILYNPQFSAKLYFEQHKDKYISFYDKTRINVYEEGFAKTEFDFLNNRESKFVFYINLASKDDLGQLNLLIEKLNLRIADYLNPGFYKVKDNLFLALADIKSDNPHIAQPNLDCTKVFEKIINGEINFNEVKPYYNLILSSLQQDFIGVKTANQPIGKLRDKMDSEKIGVVFRCTPNYAFSVANMIISIEKYSKDKNIDYIIYTDDANNKTFNQCEAIVKHFNRKLTLKPYDTNKISKIGIDDSFLKKRYTYIIFSLFEIFDLLDEYEHVFAMDSDMLVVDDFFDVLNQGEFCFRPARKIGEVVNADFEFNDVKCPNAAFMYINRKLKYKNLTNECYEILKKYHKNIKVTFEQVCLAILIYRNKIQPTYLNEAYNCPFASNNINKAKVLHYITADKPWDNEEILTAIPEYLCNINKFNKITSNKFEKENIICKRAYNENFKELFYARYNSFLLNETTKLTQLSVDEYSFNNHITFNFKKCNLEFAVDVSYKTNWFFVRNSLAEINKANNIKNYELKIRFSFENRYKVIHEYKSKLLSLGYVLNELNDEFTFEKNIRTDLLIQHLSELIAISTRISEN